MGGAGDGAQGLSPSLRPFQGVRVTQTFPFTDETLRPREKTIHKVNKRTAGSRCLAGGWCALLTPAGLGGEKGDGPRDQQLRTSELQKPRLGWSRAGAAGLTQHFTETEASWMLTCEAPSHGLEPWFRG